MRHTPVLLHEAIDGLDIKPGEVFVDGTLGAGGHTEEVYRRFGNTVAMIGIDLDLEAIERTKKHLPKDCNVKYSQGNFRNIDQICEGLGVKKVDKILLDVGLSSNQFENSNRGFSFQKDEPLLMTFSRPSLNNLTAKEILNSWEEENIATLLESYGEERFARKIAKGIVENRKTKPIETTFQLVNIIKNSTPTFYHHKKIHPATKTFQAIRIAVNDELGNLKEGIEKSFQLLNIGGRLAVISFHSLEDRIVKKFFLSKGGKDLNEGLIITKKPIIPSEKEIEENPRSRSAKLRIIARKK